MLKQQRFAKTVVLQQSEFELEEYAIGPDRIVVSGGELDGQKLPITSVAHLNGEGSLLVTFCEQRSLLTLWVWKPYTHVCDVDGRTLSSPFELHQIK